MTPPVPSQVRVARIYSGAQMLSTRGVSPVVPISWPGKHPLEQDWWWIDATRFCVDIGDTLGQVGYSIVGGDGQLTVGNSCISADALHAGFWLAGGTPGCKYIVRCSLLCATTGIRWGGDILLPIVSVASVTPPCASVITNGGDTVLLGGIPYPSGN